MAARTAEQATRLKAGLAETRGVRLVTPAAEELSAGIVCFDVDGQDPPEVVAALAGEGIAASVTPYAEAHVRAGPSIVTTPAQVDALVAAVAGVAGRSG